MMTEVSGSGATSVLVPPVLTEWSPDGVSWCVADILALARLWALEVGVVMMQLVYRTANAFGPRPCWLSRRLGLPAARGQERHALRHRWQACKGAGNVGPGLELARH